MKATCTRSRYPSSDPGADAISQWTINWGDSAQVVIGQSQRALPIYMLMVQITTPISATATDEDGTYAAGNMVAVTVNNVAPTLVISGAADVDEGSVYTLSLSSSDPGADTISQWTIDWGDGAPQVVSGNPAERYAHVRGWRRQLHDQRHGDG